MFLFFIKKFVNDNKVIFIINRILILLCLFELFVLFKILEKAGSGTCTKQVHVYDKNHKNGGSGVAEPPRWDRRAFIPEAYVLSTSVVASQLRGWRTHRSAWEPFF